MSCFVTWAAVPGLTLDNIHNYRKSMMSGKAYDDHVKVIKQNPSEGFPVVLTRVTMPHMYSHRSILTTHYSSKDNDVPFETMSSSWGNDKIASQLMSKKEHQEDVFSFMHLNYIKAWIDTENPNVC